MHRSASTSRASDEYSINISPLSKGSPGIKTVEIDQLPTYDPVSDISKKETSRFKSSENTIHIIPLVLIMCAIILWVFSRPEVDVVSKGQSILARIEGLTIDSVHNRSGTPPGARLENLDQPEHIENGEPKRTSENKPE